MGKKMFIKALLTASSVTLLGGGIATSLVLSGCSKKVNSYYHVETSEKSLSTGQSTTLTSYKNDIPYPGQFIAEGESADLVEIIDNLLTLRTAPAAKATIVIKEIIQNITTTIDLLPDEPIHYTIASSKNSLAKDESAELSCYANGEAYVGNFVAEGESASLVEIIGNLLTLHTAPATKTTIVIKETIQNITTTIDLLPDEPIHYTITSSKNSLAKGEDAELSCYANGTAYVGNFVAEGEASDLVNISDGYITLNTAPAERVTLTINETMQNISTTIDLLPDEVTHYSVKSSKNSLSQITDIAILTSYENTEVYVGNYEVEGDDADLVTINNSTVVLNALMTEFKTIVIKETTHGATTTIDLLPSALYLGVVAGSTQIPYNSSSTIKTFGNIANNLQYTLSPAIDWLASANITVTINSTDNTISVQNNNNQATDVTFTIYANEGEVISNTLSITCYKQPSLDLETDNDSLYATQNAALGLSYNGEDVTDDAIFEPDTTQGEWPEQVVLNGTEISYSETVPADTSVWVKVTYRDQYRNEYSTSRQITIKQDTYISIPNSSVAATTTAYVGDTGSSTLYGSSDFGANKLDIASYMSQLPTEFSPIVHLKFSAGDYFNTIKGAMWDTTYVYPAGVNKIIIEGADDKSTSFGPKVFAGNSTSLVYGGTFLFARKTTNETVKQNIEVKNITISNVNEAVSYTSSDYDVRNDGEGLRFESSIYGNIKISNCFISVNSNHNNDASNHHNNGAKAIYVKNNIYYEDSSLNIENNTIMAYAYSDDNDQSWVSAIRIGDGIRIKGTSTNSVNNGHIFIKNNLISSYWSYTDTSIIPDSSYAFGIEVYSQMGDASSIDIRDNYVSSRLYTRDYDHDKQDFWAVGIGFVQQLKGNINIDNNMISAFSDNDETEGWWEYDDGASAYGIHVQSNASNVAAFNIKNNIIAATEYEYDVTNDSNPAPADAKAIWFVGGFSGNKPLLFLENNVLVAEQRGRSQQSDTMWALGLCIDGTFSQEIFSGSNNLFYYSKTSNNFTSGHWGSLRLGASDYSNSVLAHQLFGNANPAGIQTTTDNLSFSQTTDTVTGAVYYKFYIFYNKTNVYVAYIKNKLLDIKNKTTQNINNYTILDQLIVQLP